MPMVWEASASATGSRVLLGYSRFCSNPTRSLFCSNLNLSSSIPLCRTPFCSTLTATPSYWDRRCGLVLKSPTPLKPIQFQPKHKQILAIWGIEDLQFQPKRKRSSSSAFQKSGALLVLAAVLLLSNPLSAQALSPVLRNHLVNQMQRSTVEADTKDTKTKKLSLVENIIVCAVCACLVTVIFCMLVHILIPDDIIVLQLQFRYPLKGMIPLIDKYNRVVAEDTRNLCLLVNGLGLLLLNYQRQCISVSSFASCVKGSLAEAYVRLTYLRAEQYESLQNQCLKDVTYCNPEESDNVFVMIYVDLGVKGYEMSSFNGIKSVKDAVDKILSIPLGHICLFQTSYKYWAKEGWN